MKIISLVCLFLFSNLTFNALAQERKTEDLSHTQRHELARQLTHSGSYYLAINQLQQLVSEYPDEIIYKHHLGDAYFRSRDYNSAAKWYGKVIEEENKNKAKKAPPISLAMYRYAECLKYNGKYEMAANYFEGFSKSNYKENKKESYKTWAKQEVKACQYALVLKKQKLEVKIDHVGNEINSGYSDFAPVYSSDTSLVYASLQQDFVVTHAHGERLFEHVKLYEVFKDDTSWSEPQEVKGVNSSFAHSANASFSPDGKQMLFTRCRPNAQHQVLCQIFLSNWDGKKWSKPKKLKHGINQAGYTNTQPHWIQYKDAKGKPTDYIYFSSNRKGTLGGLDLFYVLRKPDGTFGKVASCGNVINTVKDEMSPFYDQEHGLMYFSSTGHAGLGGYDVFRSQGALNKWTKPENVGQPINSSLDDTYFIFEPKSKTQGLLVSNRPGGNQLLSPTCCDDVYHYDIALPSLLVVRLEDSTTGQILEKSSCVITTVPQSESSTLSQDSKIDSIQPNVASWPLKALSIKQPDKIFYQLPSKEVLSVYAHADGYQSFEVILYTDDKAQLVHTPIASNARINRRENPIELVIKLVKSKEVIPKEDTTEIASMTFDKALPKGSIEKSLPENKETKPTTSADIPIDKKDQEKTMQALTSTSPKAKPLFSTVPNMDALIQTMLKQGKNINFESKLHFNYNQIGLDRISELELDSLASVMKVDLKAKVFIATHTDHKGSMAYNQKLSDNRANYLANYLKNHGIPASRIQANGYGETRPVQPNTLPDGSDNPEGRRRNRRTEIVLLEP